MSSVACFTCVCHVLTSVQTLSAHVSAADFPPPPHPAPAKRRAAAPAAVDIAIEPGARIA
jgi:hypothetical protein